MITLKFANEQIYRIHEMDIHLYANSGIWDLLQIEISENKYILKNTYIPRYVDTFEVFMHHLRGYHINLRYICTLKIVDIQTFIGFLIADNFVYKIRTMSSIINDLAYMVCPKTLSYDNLIETFNRKDDDYKLNSKMLWLEIQELIKEMDYCIDPKIQYMPHKYLKKQIIILKEKKTYETFVNDLNVKFPLLMIQLVKIISSTTGKALSKNYEENIKQRIKNDPELAKELFKKLNDMKILHTLMAFIGCFTSLVY